MSLNSLGLGFVFTARDLASGAMSRLQRRFSSLDDRVSRGSARMEGAFRRLGVGLAAFTAGAAAVGGGLALASAAGTFEQRLVGVGAITRATAEDMAALREAAIQAGVGTQFSPDQAVEGLEALATAGQTARQATESLLPVLNLATGSLGQLGVGEAASAVVGTLNAYSLGADQAATVTDRLLHITQLSNFQARDFETGLSKAASTGATFGQSMNDVLVTLGLLRNRNIDASSSATALREAIRRVGSMRPAQDALGPGVSVFDQDTGRMRSIIDIIQDFGRASADMSEQERNRRLNQAFGARGMLAYQAVMSATFTTMRDGREVTLQGAEAIDAMRAEMEGAGGTAGRFRSQLEDTFAGQMTLLRGTLQTLAVVVGEPFAEVFRPVVGAVVEGLNGLLRAIQAVPAPIRRAFAVVMTAAGGFLAMVGGAIATEAAITLLAGALEAIAIAVGGLLAILLPAIVVVAALGAVVAGFVVAVRRDVGGLGDLFDGAGRRVRLFFQGLTQLFEQGGFSGAVRDELDRAENRGVRQFLVRLYQLAFRAQRLWEGFTSGFTQAVEEAEPVFADLRAALTDLGRELTSVFGDATDQASSLPSSQFASWGARVGRAVATVVRWFARFVAVGARVAAGVLPGIRQMASVIGPAFQGISQSVGQFMQALRGLSGESQGAEGAAQSSTESWRQLGVVIGNLLGVFVSFNLWLATQVIDGLTTVLRAVGAVRGAFAALGQWVLATGGALRDLFAVTIPNAAASALGRLLRVLEQMRAAAAPVLRMLGVEIGGRPLAEMVGLGGAADATAVAGGAREAAGAPGAATSSGGGSVGPMPAVAEVGRRGSEAAGLAAQLAALTEATRRTGTAPIHVQLQVDGETLAEVTHEASRDVATRSFSPVPSF